MVPGAYLEPHSPLYITQEEWAAMWRKALGADGKRIIDIWVTENHGEVITWSRSLAPIRKALGFLDTEDQSEDLVDIGDDDDGLEWKVAKILTYR